MGLRVYYNEFDKKKCAALLQLMKDGHISKGDIDDRSIQEVKAEDVREYDRCHFFAGIGLWDYALQLAGWEDQPVWTGSCPCQPFSTAGRQKGKADDRHLWPEWFRLIQECKPSTIFGEQVASAITKGWLDDVYQGLEAQDYAVGSTVLPACSTGNPHGRNRLWFVGNSEHNGWYEAETTKSLAKTVSNQPKRKISTCKSERAGSPRMLSDGNIQWKKYPDGKFRAIEPGIPLLADGYPERVGIIHCAGDAIVPQVAAEFIGAYMEVAA